MNINFQPFPALTTKRLILRQLNMNDGEELTKLRSDTSVNQYLVRPKTVSVEETMTFVEKIDKLVATNTSIYWVLCLKEDEKLIGTACIWNLVPEMAMADLGYELSPAYQGKGYMNEAVEKIIQFGFEQMELKTLIGVTHPGNERSLNVLKRNGFVKDENFAYVSKKDAAGDVVYYLVR